MWRNDWLGEGTGEPEMNLSQREVCVARRWIAHSTRHIQILPAPKQLGQELEAACCTGGEKQRMIVSGDERQGEYGKQPVEELPPSFFPGAQSMLNKARPPHRGHAIWRRGHCLRSFCFGRSILPRSRNLSELSLWISFSSCPQETKLLKQTTLTVKSS